ncbi:MAG: hypothetical protein B6229_01400 [Spirochaetaceae bacterium 4572_7]|nr:MAG: hypothetical protein B6229_01400 [Spirochaetaceae bacterium 4572_7]
MKKIILIIFIVVSYTLYSSDFYSTISVNNFHFNDDNNILSTDYIFETSEVLSQEISDGLFLIAGFNKSYITDYSIFTDFEITNNLFGFNIGILTNFLNGGSKPITPGLNYGLNFIIPGLFLVDMNLQNSIPNASQLEESITISNYNMKIGIYAGEAIISANIESISGSKGSIMTSTASSDIKYFVNLDLFSRFSKYRISVDFGWENIKKEVTSISIANDILSSALTEEYSAGSAYFNGNLTLLVTDYISVDVGLLLHLIKVPLKNVDTFPTDKFNWGSNIGVTIKF